jgi:PIN domain nuclease of toxin-antitoxin system
MKGGASELLLDTHVWLWLALGVPKKIAPTAMSAIEEAGKSGKLLVSAISVWEIALLESRQRIVPSGDQACRLEPASNHCRQRQLAG